jgi:hypothetical protein
MARSDEFDWVVQKPSKGWLGSSAAASNSEFGDDEQATAKKRTKGNQLQAPQGAGWPSCMAVGDDAAESPDAGLA